VRETVLLGPRSHDPLHLGKPIKLRNGRWLKADGYTDAPATY
jgi:hypothetical protein